MKKKQIIGLVVAAAVFIVTGAASVLTNTFSQRILDSTVSETLAGGLEFSPPAQDYLAVVSVEGTIQEQTVCGVRRGAICIPPPWSIWTG